jgi:hypothetical protein
LDDWLFEFLTRHQMRYRPFDWPTLDSEEGMMFLEVWSRAFRGANVTEADADEASISLGAAPPRYRSEHLPAILKAVRVIREGRSSRLRVYESPYPANPPDPVVLPDGVKDYQEYWRYLCGGVVPNIRRVK